METTDNSNVTTAVPKKKMWIEAQYLSPELNIHFSALLPHFSATQWSMLCHHFLAVLLEFQIQSQVGTTAEAHIHDELPNRQLRAENITGYVTRWKKLSLLEKKGHCTADEDCGSK